MTPTPPTEADELIQLKTRIATLWANREGLKQQLAAGTLAPHAGLRQLETLDRELSDLDSRFEALMRAERVFD